MKNSTKQLNKRSVSPLIPKVEQRVIKGQAIDGSQRRKKTNTPSNPYGKIMKDFETYGKADKKKNSNYFKEALKNNDSGNKYRIVTEPVDDRIMHLVNSSFGRVSKSKQKEAGASKPTQFNLRASSHSKEKIKIAQTHCKNCQRYEQELQHLQSKLSKMLNLKVLWKSGQISLCDVKEQFRLHGVSGKHAGKAQKASEEILQQAKQHMLDMMKDIESLTVIDYTKMLSLEVMKHQGMENGNVEHQEMEVKSLLGLLRNASEGKVNEWDLEDPEDSSYLRMMIRNMKCRLSHYLRENLQLKIKKAILEKAEEISTESEEYLRKVIQNVLSSYTIDHT